jgi:predicted nucleic-acid-binding protein
MSKSGLDTNVLVRYLTRDDGKQYQAACRVIDHADAETIFVLSPIVMCELVWVLESAYDYRRDEIAEALEKIMTTAQFEMIDKNLLRKSLDAYRQGKGDFADYYVGYRNRAEGAHQTFTFDKALKHSEMFTCI